MSRSKFENGISFYEITRKIEEFIDRHNDLDSKQEKEENNMSSRPRLLHLSIILTSNVYM